MDEIMMDIGKQFYGSFIPEIVIDNKENGVSYQDKKLVASVLGKHFVEGVNITAVHDKVKDNAPVNIEFTFGFIKAKAFFLNSKYKQIDTFYQTKPLFKMRKDFLYEDIRSLYKNGEVWESNAQFLRMCEFINFLLSINSQEEYEVYVRAAKIADWHSIFILFKDEVESRYNRVDFLINEGDCEFFNNDELLKIFYDICLIY